MGFRGRFQRLLVALPLACAGSAALFAQQQPTFRSGTEIVSLFVTVNDAQKRLVPDLEQGDFEVLDNESRNLWCRSKTTCNPSPSSSCSIRAAA